MAYIYKITNDINQKIYIGKTEQSIQLRFKEHLRDYKKERCEKRPLYAAMNKYGPEHFHIELIEETDNPEERERYWIQYYNSYHNGYNATLGGDGKKYIDYDLVVETYQNLHNCVKVADTLNICVDSVYDILELRGIPRIKDGSLQKEVLSKKVVAYKNNLPVKTFSSMSDAARYLIEEGITSSKLNGITSHISATCKGKRKTAYGYEWRYV